MENSMAVQIINPDSGERNEFVSKRFDPFSMHMRYRLGWIMDWVKP